MNNIFELKEKAQKQGLDIEEQIELIELLMITSDVVSTQIIPSVQLVDADEDIWKETGHQQIIIDLYNE